MRIVQVDAFTSVRFRGNPAAVCVLEREHDDGWMADVAREMNLSETSFLRRLDDGAWSLRWFTPTVEVDLCGHATLASAHVLWQDGLAGPDDTLRFETRSGVLTARRDGDAIMLDFPAEPATQCEPPRALIDALRVSNVVAAGRNRFDWLVEVEDAAVVRALRPDMAQLATVDMRGVIVTARADDGTPDAGQPGEHDFVSRWFGPQSGVDEDPVTGSAHCCLAPWWAQRLGRTALRGYQASARGGTVGVRLIGDRVELTGTAVIVMRGELV